MSKILGVFWVMQYIYSSTFVLAQIGRWADVCDLQLCHIGGTYQWVASSNNEEGWKWQANRCISLRLFGNLAGVGVLSCNFPRNMSHISILPNKFLLQVLNVSWFGVEPYGCNQSVGANVRVSPPEVPPFITGDFKLDLEYLFIWYSTPPQNDSKWKDISSSW